MKLYYTPGACSLAPHIVACEIGLSLEYEKVNVRTQATDSGHCYAKINPKGYVPALALDGGHVLTEVCAILQYLADQDPEARILPKAGTIDRYRAQEWLGFISSELHKGFAPLWKPAMPDAARRLAVDHLHQRFQYLEHCLLQNSYLMGEWFSAADAYCFTVLNWTRFHRIDLTPYGRIDAFIRRVAQRPMVQRALEAEGLPKVA